MKRLGLLFLFLTTFYCTRHFYNETPEDSPTSEELKFLQSKKIGLIGFYPFKIEQKEVSINTILNTDIEIRKPSHRQIIEFVNSDNKRKVFWNNFKK